jgi:hypothetical protein
MFIYVLHSTVVQRNIKTRSARQRVSQATGAFDATITTVLDTMSGTVANNAAACANNQQQLRLIIDASTARYMGEFTGLLMEERVHALNTGLVVNVAQSCILTIALFTSLGSFQQYVTTLNWTESCFSRLNLLAGELVQFISDNNQLSSDFMRIETALRKIRYTG